VYGIDFGTSNTVVSARRGSAARVLELEGLGTVVPSLLYFERDRPFSAGAEAREDYARALERWKGERDLYARFRFFQGLKFALRDELFTGTAVFGRRWKAEELVGAFLRVVKERADRAAGAEIREAVVGRPVRLSADPASEAAILERYRSACRLAGIETMHFVAEPIAAAASLVGSLEGLALVFDFGGGTLDIAVAELSGGKARVLASAGAELGGYALDEDLSRARIIRHFGYGSTFRTMTGRDLRLPSWITNQVASFYALPLSDIARTREAIRELMFEARSKEALRGLVAFLDANMAFGLFERVDEAKIGLSDGEEAAIRFAVPPHVAFEERITRPQFEELVAPRVAEAERLVDRALAEAGVAAGAVARVLRVGGSSQVPAFAAMLERRFPGRVERGEVFTSISAGLTAAWEAGLGSD